MTKSYCKAVIGLGFGDEGKGATVNSLCRHDPNNTLVVRFNGGQQAGHTVTDADGDQHVFSNFGSGTLLQVPTYWSSYCTIDPVGMMKELTALQCSFGILPKLYVSQDCPVTTPYDKLRNITDAEMLAHGTCGAGVGSTIQREEDFYSLQVGDLFYPQIVFMKMKLIKDYYALGQPEMGAFAKAVQQMLTLITVVDDIPESKNYVCEGAQGLLLDQHHGFFPHVTRSNTGSKNVLEMFDKVSYYLVTRAYQTRHGAGPMTNSNMIRTFGSNRWETNKHNPYQGHFRTTVLDLDLLIYGMQRDLGIRRANRGNVTLVVTCCDQMERGFQYTVEGVVHVPTSREEFKNVLINY